MNGNPYENTFGQGYGNPFESIFNSTGNAYSQLEQTASQQANAFHDRETEMADLCRRACTFLKEQGFRMKWETDRSRFKHTRVVLWKTGDDTAAGPWAETKRGALVALARAVLP